MGRLLEFILFAVVAYFVFKFLNRLFSKPYNKTNNSSASRKYTKEHKTKTESEKDINWDAETVDYEEIENNDDEKK